VISWNINTACNYRCSYCTQRFKEDRGRWSRDTPRFLEAFARLSGPWEIKLSGGEPFVHPTLLEIAEGLASLKHRVGVVTNFSADESKLSRFIAACRGRVSMVSCSLHLEYVPKLEAFADKAAWLHRELTSAQEPSLPAPGVHVTCVATRAVLPRLPLIKQIFADRGVTFKVQPEKQDRDVIAYTTQERAQLLALGGHNLMGEIDPSFLGQPCWAGSRYFIMDDEGNTFRCYPARRRKLQSLGNFLTHEFRLFEDALPCQYSYCNCTVPIARRMMPRSLEVVHEV
jgi:hypothetical protein